MVKEAGPRLCDPASCLHLPTRAISRNLGPIFLTIPVQRDPISARPAATVQESDLSYSVHEEEKKMGQNKNPIDGLGPPKI